MKHFEWFIKGFGLLLTFLWTGKIYSYFFEISQADFVGLLLVMIISLLIFHQVKSHLFVKKSLLLVVLVLPLPMLLHPIISTLLTITDLSWINIYLFGIILVGAVVLVSTSSASLITFSLVVAFFLPYDFEKEQLQFYDRVESSVETRKGSAQLVKWKDDLWVYYNRQLQFSTIDRHMYQEAYIQPVMQFIRQEDRVLIIGGDSGVVEDELSKFEEDFNIDVLVLDKDYHDFVRNSYKLPLQEIKNKRLIARTNFFEYLWENSDTYNLIIIDLPDPVNVDYKQYYMPEFYELCNQSLTDQGLLVTQSGDHYQNSGSSNSIWKSVQEAGFDILPYHAQIPTLGQWSWIIGSKQISRREMIETLKNIDVKTPTRWWNQGAMDMMLAFGKLTYFGEKSTRTSNFWRE